MQQIQCCLTRLQHVCCTLCTPSRTTTKHIQDLHGVTWASAAPAPPSGRGGPRCPSLQLAAFAMLDAVDAPGVLRGPGTIVTSVAQSWSARKARSSTTLPMSATSMPSTGVHVRHTRLVTVRLRKVSLSRKA